MIDWLEIVATSTAYVILAVLGALLLVGLWRFTSWLPRPWLPLQRLLFASWKGIDVFTAFVIFFMIPILVDETLRKAGVFDWLYGDQDDPAIREPEQFLSSALAMPLVIGLIVLGLRQLRGTRLNELGITPVRAGTNVGVGYTVWLVVAPLTLILHYLVWSATPWEWVGQHPLERAAKQPWEVWETLLFCGVAVVLAPVVEELLFRGILLPWQQQGGWEAQATMAFCATFCAVIFGTISRNKQPDSIQFNPAPAIFVLAMLPGIFLVPFLWRKRDAPDVEMERPPIEQEPTATDSQATPSRSTVDTQPARVIEGKISALLRRTGADRSQTGLAIYTNGLFFAAVHSFAWPAPISLFLLGMILAWLRYRTSSLIGCVTVHSLFNAVSMFGMLLERACKE